MKGTKLFTRFLNQMKTTCQDLPEHRRGQNLQYSLSDAVFSAFGVFFTQSASFLAYQRLLEKNKGRSNAQNLFQVAHIPSDNQIRNLLDPLAPELLYPLFEWGLQSLEQSGQLDEFRSYQQQLLLSCDGTGTHSSQTIHCSNCTHQELSNGQTAYTHLAILPVLVKPGESRVLVLEPEFIVPQDGHDKQDCERAAIKRWLARCGQRFGQRGCTVLGDDLYACQPVCERLLDAKLNFILVCKPDSHVALYEHLTFLEKSGLVEQVTERHWNGRYGEIHQYRFANDLPLRRGEDALRVNWCEISVQREDTGEQLYYNTFLTDFGLTAENVIPIARDGRARWKSENENHNVLKTKGYHLEHNFGHGQQNLANFLLTLNLLAFLLHTLLDLQDEAYHLLRQTLVVRRTFFNDLRALLRYLLFDDWEQLIRFMLIGLEVLPDA